MLFRTMFVFAALGGMLLGSSPVLAGAVTAETPPKPAATGTEPGAADVASMPTAQETAPAPFVVVDHVKLNMEFTDEDMAVLQEMAKVVKQVLSEATLPRETAPWESVEFDLQGDSKVVEAPLKAALTIRKRTFDQTRPDTRTFYYDPAQLAEFKTNLRIYFRDTLQVAFVEKPTVPTSAGDMLGLKLKVSADELEILKKMSETVKSIMAQAEPLPTARNKEGELIPRILELRLDSEIAAPPYAAAFALEDVDRNEEAERKIYVFFYDPNDPEALHRELRAYLSPVLQVSFPSQDEADHAEVATVDKLETIPVQVEEIQPASEAKPE